MSVTVFNPGTLPLSDSTYPEGPTNYSNAPDYNYWIVEGGLGTNPPDPSWFCAVADQPATVESRTDNSHVLNQLVYTAVGGETVISLALPPNIQPASFYLSTSPILTQADISTMVAEDIPFTIEPDANGAFTISGGVLTYTANSGTATSYFTPGTQWRLGALWPLALQGYKIQIATISSTSPGATITATFVGPAPPDGSYSTLSVAYLVPVVSSRVPGSVSLSIGTLNYETGALNITLDVALTMGQNLYATYGILRSNFGSFVTPWSGTANLQAGSGPATIVLPTQTYSAQYGLPMYTNSQWLVLRNFGFNTSNIPSGAVIKRICFAWEGTAIGAHASAIGAINPALLVGNAIARAPFTQGNGDLPMENYYDPAKSFPFDASFGSYSGFWPDAFLRSFGNAPNTPWPGTTANDGSSEFSCSETWNQDYFQEGKFLLGSLRSGFTSQGDPAVTVTPAQTYDPGFGFAVAAWNGDESLFAYGGGDPTANQATVTVKSVRIFVYYTYTPSPPPTPPSDFLTYVYDFPTKSWFRIQRGFASLAVFEVGEGQQILVGGGTDGFVYVIDDQNGLYPTPGNLPISTFRPALINFGDDGVAHRFVSLELEFSAKLVADDIAVTFWLDPNDVDNPGTGRTLKLSPIIGANRYIGYPETGTGQGGAVCQHLLLSIDAAATANPGILRGVKLTAETVEGTLPKTSPNA